MRKKAQIEPRLLLIGLDACPPALVERWCDDGSLPNLRRLRDEGRQGGVDSDADLFPGGVWPSFFTLSDVSVHGTYHFLQWDAASARFRVPGPDWCEITPFWRGLAREGVATIALDIPFSLSKKGLPGVTEVVGWGTHEGSWSASWPAGLLEELARRHGRSSQVREVPGPRSDAALRRELDALVADVGRRASIVADLASRFGWRLLIACVTETHRAGHWYWGERCTGIPQGGLREVLRAFDAVIPRLEALLGPEDHLAVFSLHGMGPKYDADGFSEAINRHLEPSREMRLGRQLDPVFLLRRILPPALLRRVVERLPKEAYNRLFEHYTNAGRDWSQMRAFLHPLEHLWYLLAGGNQREDAVEAREDLLDWLCDEFASMTTPDGEGVVGSILRPAQRYGGPRLSLLPDLVVRPVDRTLGPSIVLKDGTRLSAEPRTWQDGQHLPAGFYIQRGPGIAPGSSGPAVAGDELARFLCQPAGLVVKRS